MGRSMSDNEQKAFQPSWELARSFGCLAAAVGRRACSGRVCGPASRSLSTNWIFFRDADEPGPIAPGALRGQRIPGQDPFARAALTAFCGAVQARLAAAVDFDPDLPPRNRLLTQHADAAVVERGPVVKRITFLKDREFVFHGKMRLHAKFGRCRKAALMPFPKQTVARASRFLRSGARWLFTVAAAVSAAFAGAGALPSRHRRPVADK
jgi:hypothetical protein